MFPSDQMTIQVELDEDYGGAHKYIFINSLGFSDGLARYAPSEQTIQFVQKNSDGTIIPGVQSEQLAIALLDRTKKLNERFPSDYNEQMMRGLKMFLEACKDRIIDRINRDVMGDLKQ